MDPKEKVLRTTDEATRKEAEKIINEQTVLDGKLSTDWIVYVNATVILHMNKEAGMKGAEAREGVRGMVHELLKTVQRNPQDHIYVDAPVIRDGRP